MPGKDLDHIAAQLPGGAGSDILLTVEVPEHLGAVVFDALVVFVDNHERFSRLVVAVDGEKLIVVEQNAAISPVLVRMDIAARSRGVDIGGDGQSADQPEVALLRGGAAAGANSQRRQRKAQQQAQNQGQGGESFADFHGGVASFGYIFPFA